MAFCPAVYRLPVMGSPRNIGSSLLPTFSTFVGCTHNISAPHTYSRWYIGFRPSISAPHQPWYDASYS